jgi:A/G-specific adenine glycosylase
MLQQTQVSRVLGKYAAFITRFPTIRSLAKASLRDILHAWQGLGYNRRALALKRMAEEVVRNHGGQVPSDRLLLESLPGIGQSTSGAVCAFAFNQPVIFIETNIRSVFLHHFFNGKDKVSDEQLILHIEKTLDTKNPRRWYSALMDYGVYLKERAVNPSRRSLHYRRQSRFEGSRRQVRGMILRLLVSRGRMNQRQLSCHLDIPGRTLLCALDSLHKEGLIKKKGPLFGV